MYSFDVIKIPMRTNTRIEETNIFDAVDAGDIFYFDPDVIFHKEFYDYGFLENIPKEECIFKCNVPTFNTAFGSYSYGDIVDSENFSEKQLWEFCLIGRLKKELKPEGYVAPSKEQKSEPKKDRAPKKEFKYADIAKKLGIKFSEFKKRATELNFEIKKRDDKVAKSKMDKILKALR